MTQEIMRIEDAPRLTLIDYIENTLGDDLYSPIIIINVDKPEHTIKSHARNCKWVLRAKASKWKTVGGIGRDGGWMIFNSPHKAAEWCSMNFPTYKITLCKSCNKPELLALAA